MHSPVHMDMQFWAPNNQELILEPRQTCSVILREHFIQMSGTPLTARTLRIRGASTDGLGFSVGLGREEAIVLERVAETRDDAAQDDPDRMASQRLLATAYQVNG